MTDAHTRIDTEVKSNDVVLFMKGTPDFPMCGFSSQVVQILGYLGVPYKGVNVLEDQARYVLAVDPDCAADILYAAQAVGVAAVPIGFTGGTELILPGGEAISVERLKAAHESWLPTYMSGELPPSS